MSRAVRRVLTLFLIALCPTTMAARVHVDAAPAIPANCVEHTSFDGGPDYPGDYRCAGLAIDFHVAGVSHSPSPLWAGQWLFVDELGSYRLGLCTFNRGIHPTTNAPSTPVTQSFPNDPSGAKRAYLTWRHGNTTDNLTAAALWAVFHFYAQDAAGSNRASNAATPLIASLAGISEASGRDDIETRAIGLDVEAARFSSPFALTVTAATNGAGTAHLTSGSEPVGGVDVDLVAAGGLFDNGAAAITVITDASGVAPFQLAIDGQNDQPVTVTATAAAPGEPQVYRGAAADPVGHLPQTLITRGPTSVLSALVVATVVVPTTTTSVPPTTTTTSTTSVPPTTTTLVTTTTSTTTTTTSVPPTTTTLPPTTTTTTAATTTAPPITTPAATTTTTPPITVNTVTEVSMVPIDLTPSTPPSLPPLPAATAVPVSVASLPVTGSSANGPAYLGTALLVAGIGMIGAVRRRSARHPAASPDGPQDFW